MILLEVGVRDKLGRRTNENYIHKPLIFTQIRKHKMTAAL